MRTHDNQVGIKFIGLIQNFFGHCASRLMQTDLDTVLSYLLLPSGKLGFLILILRDGFRHRLKGWNWHARHRRKLRHARKTVAEHARRRCRGEFFYVNKMDFRIESLGKPPGQILGPGAADAAGVGHWRSAPQNPREYIV